MPLKHIYTDGGYYNNIGSWAWVEVDPTTNDILASDSGSVTETTNNRMEMQAVINAVHKHTPGSRLRIFSDSGYIVTGHNDPAYLKKWQINGWKTSKKKPVENQDLWAELILIDQLYDIKYVLIPGHSKDPSSLHKRYNDLCDRMCTEEREYAQRLLGMDDTIRIGDILIPGRCPDSCGFHGEDYQGGPCYRCPVMLCREPESVVPANQYRLDWAIQWDEYFRGRVDKPHLSL